MPVPLLRMKSELGTFGFGVPFFAFAVFWTFGAVEQTERRTAHSGGWPSWFPYLWGGMFMCIGAWMLLSPIRAWWAARHTVYVITSRRAVSIQGGRKRAIVSFEGERMITFEKRENSSGAGDIVFEREASRGAKGRTIYRDVGFLGLADARDAERQLRSAYEQGSERPR